MIKKDHRFRDIALIIIAAYFCAQSYYIVLKMWTSLDFNDKVNAMESVILTTVVLCEVLEILYFYKFDDTKSELYTGELFGLEIQIQYKYGEQAVFRGRNLIRASIERRRRLKQKTNRRFSKNNRPKDGAKTAEREDVYEGSNSTGITMTMKNQSSASNVDHIIMNEQSSHKFVNDPHRTNYSESITHTSSDDNEQDFQESSASFVSRPSDDVVYPFERCTKYENRIKIGQTPTSSGDKRKLKFFHDKSVEIIEGLLSNNLNFTRAGLTLLKGISGALLLVPLHGFISYMLGFIEFHELKFTFMVYVPFTGSSSPGNLAQFVGVSLVQTIYMYLFYMLGADSFLLESLSNTTLKTEIKLFLNSLEKFDAIFCAKKWDEEDTSLEARLRKLKIFESFRHIVAHHKTIFRKTRIFQEMMAFLTIYFNLAVCAAMSIALFLVDQGEFFFKVKYAIAALCLGIALALYSQEGQDIEDGFEEMKDALYRISWHNMSLSMRKSLVILLTRHSLPPKVTGSYGIFVINRQNLSMIMRASYSYLNFLNQFKRG